MDHSLSNTTPSSSLSAIAQKYSSDRPDRPAIFAPFSRTLVVTSLCQSFLKNMLLAQLVEALANHDAQEELDFSYHKNGNARECILEILASLNAPEDLQKEIETITHLLALHCQLFQRKITFELTVWQKKFQKVARSPLIDRTALLEALSDKYYSWIATQKGHLQKPWLYIKATLSEDHDFQDYYPIASSFPSPRDPSEQQLLLRAYQAKIALFAPTHLEIEDKIGRHSKILAKARQDLKLLQALSIKIQKTLEDTRWTQDSLSETVLALAASHHELQDLSSSIAPTSLLGSDLESLSAHIATQQDQIQRQWIQAKDSPDCLKTALGCYLEKLLSLYPSRLCNPLVTPLWIARCTGLGGPMIAQGLEEKFRQELQGLPIDPEEASQLQSDVLFACNLLVTYCSPEDFPTLSSHQLYARIASQSHIPDSATTWFTMSSKKPPSAYKERFHSLSESEYRKTLLQKDPQDSAFASCSSSLPSTHSLEVRQIDIHFEPKCRADTKDLNGHEPSRRSALLFSPKSEPFGSPKSDPLLQEASFLPLLTPRGAQAEHKRIPSVETPSKTALAPLADRRDLLKAPVQSVRKEIGRPLSKK